MCVFVLILVVASPRVVDRYFTHVCDRFIQDSVFLGLGIFVSYIQLRRRHMHLHAFAHLRHNVVRVAPLLLFSRSPRYQVLC
ncbi:hypothetical protein EDB85DRAFT_1938428 [Lactarius pseudohatsudake]|nr:hypothetical protein EDB85DRAFT_1938428 [Lactarius pseudohatsudake]